MPVGHVSSITDDVLAEHFPASALARAEVLVAAGVVGLHRSSETSVYGSVWQGSELHSVTVGVETYASGVALFDSCSCRLGGSCEHGAAVILAKRGTGWSRGKASAWRRVLAPAAALAGSAEPDQPLALRFTVTVTPQRPWDQDYVPVAKLAVLPLAMGKRGRWIKTGTSWRQLAEPHGRSADPVPAQRRALGSMARDSSGFGYYHLPTVNLAHFGPAVWFHLEQVQRAGVELLNEYEHPGRVVVEPVPAEFALHLAHADGGGVELTGAVVSGEVTVPLPAKHAGLIGDHGAFWLDDADVLHLARFDSPVADELAALGGRRPVAIPAGEVEDFRATTGAQLAQVITISADDQSIVPRIPDPPRLVLHVDLVGEAQARLTWGFLYGDSAVQPLEFVPGKGRDHQAEGRLLHGLPLDRIPVLRRVLADRDARPIDTAISGADLIDLVSTAVPWLMEQGVGVRFDEEFPEFRESTAEPVVTIRVDDDPDTLDWYDLAVTVTIDGEEIVFATLFAALAQHHDRLLLPSGTWLRLDRPEFDQLRQLIDEARGLADSERDPGKLRINRFQSDWWQEFARLGVIEQQSRRWSQAMATMTAMATAEPVAAPVGLHATLRPYQSDGFAWLTWLHRHRLGGVLADDMGLGKTLQALALFSKVREADPNARFLVVAPTSVVTNWQREAERFAPDLGVVGIRQTGARRGASVAEVVDGAAVVVTSYTLLRLELDQYQELEWEIVVLDEAQFVKNRHSKLYQCVRRLNAVSKIAMTGTPLENSLMDLWSLLSITAPGLYPDPGRFAEVFCKPIESGAAPEMLGTLRRRIAPLLRRRTKEEVLADLPPKLEQELAIELGDKHRVVYQRQLQRERQKVLGLIDDLDQNRFQIFRSLTMLRQLAIDPALVSDEHERVGSAKLDQLVEQLTEVGLEGHRALVFSQFTRFLTRVRARLDEAGIAYAYLDGKTRNRAAVIDEFKTGEAPVFLISLKSGGFGLNLTEADYCFVLDPWWNPATEVQAVDRAHRIGQDKPVMVYRYISAGTIEEKVMELKARKQSIFDSVIGDDEGALSRTLTADDIKGLLG